MEDTEIRPILFLGSDAVLRDQCVAHLAAAGLPAKTFETIADLAASLQSAPGAVLVLDTGVLPRRQGIAQLIEYLGSRAGGAAPAFVCLAQTDSIGQRLDAMRAGAAAFFPKPVSPEDLVAGLAELSGGAKAMPSRVLVVDDKPIEAAVTAEILQRAGVETRQLEAPLSLIDAAQAFRPDLVLMDIEMADAGGLELTRILREHEGLFAVPIVLMGAADTEEVRSAVLRAGADDFLVKPPLPARLIEVVEYRARRIHELRSKLARSADRDGVTGLCTRHRLLQHIERSLNDPASPRSGRAVLFIRIDAPDRLVGALGSGGPDALLMHVANLIKTRLGPADLAARVGDFGFAIFAERGDDAALDLAAESICRSVSEHVVDVAGDQVLATVSIGVACLRPSADDAVTLIARAEKACKQAMEGGGNRVETYQSGVDQEPVDQRVDEIHTAIEDGLRSDGFQLLYQPILALRDQPGAQYDTLLQLMSSSGNGMQASELLPVAEQRGLMRKIDCWAMERALDTLKRQRGSGLDVRVFVDQAMSTIQAKSWVLWMRDQLLKRHLIESPPILQLSLSDVLEHLAVANARFELMHRLGVQLCISDFDDRAAGLRLLETQPVSMIKLALEMVQPENKARLARISQQVHDLKCQIIATGIEDPDTIGRVMDCGVDFIQGDFIQPPRDSLQFDFSDANRP